jgi:hypothetical protein
MYRERGPDVSDSASPWSRIGGSVNSAASLPFMEIRMRSLVKAIDEVRHKRQRLEEEKRRGHINDSDYASTLLKIIVETNSLNKERDEISERLKSLKGSK